MRDAMKRLRRRLAVLSFEVMADEEIDRAVGRVFEQAEEALLAASARV